MRVVAGKWLAALVALALPAASVGAATIPFTEEFAANASNWRDNSNAPGSLTWTSGTGVGGDGSVSSNFNFVSSTVGAQGPVLFRGPISASGGAFAGDWLTQGVLEFSFYVRHDAGVPVTFFARFADTIGFPGAIATSFVPTPSQPGGEWTQIVIAINAANPQFVSFEGQTFAQVFDNIGIVQVGASIPSALAGIDQVVHFELDRVSIRGVPEASSVALLGVAFGLVGLSRRFGRSH